MLSTPRQLTRLELAALSSTAGVEAVVEPGGIAGMTQLEHLSLSRFHILGGTAGLAQLLLHLQQMVQLTFLNFSYTQDVVSTAASYASLTASSKLQTLQVSCRLPAGVWEHLLTCRQLPHLQRIIFNPSPWGLPAWDPPGGTVARAGTRLVSCCPGLQHLTLIGGQYSAEQLTQLRGLSGLRSLVLHYTDPSTAGLEEVSQLTSLRRLHLVVPQDAEAFLLQLTNLKQLTHIYYQMLQTEDHMATCRRFCSCTFDYTVSDGLTSCLTTCVG